MGELFNYLEAYKVQKSANVESFLKSLNKQIAALRADSLNRRSWLTAEGSGYMIKLGKLDGEYQAKTKDQALEILVMVADHARNDDEFKAAIEKAYGGASGEPVKARKPRKPKSE